MSPDQRHAIIWTNNILLFSTLSLHWGGWGYWNSFPWMPDGTNPLTGPMLTNQRDLVAFIWGVIWGVFHRKVYDIYPEYEFENYLFKITAASSRGQWVHWPRANWPCSDCTWGSNFATICTLSVSGTKLNTHYLQQQTTIQCSAIIMW